MQLCEIVSGFLLSCANNKGHGNPVKPSKPEVKKCGMCKSMGTQSHNWISFYIWPTDKVAHIFQPRVGRGRKVYSNIKRTRVLIGGTKILFCGRGLK